MKLITGNRRNPFILNQLGFTHRTVMLVLMTFFCIFLVFKHLEGRATAEGSKITSGVAGYCLDDHDSNTVVNNEVDAWQCNNTTAQAWTVTPTTITHDGKFCLSVAGNDTTINSKIVLAPCSLAPGQVWLRDQGGFENPNSGMCLSAMKNQQNDQLIIASCNDLSSAREIWTPTSYSESGNDLSCTGSEGERIACYATKEWYNWQASSSNHENLLNMYTDGAPYEEWCADFVSYIYKEAGYPFTQGNSSGWDQNIAGNIQYMGFNMHAVGSGYVPQAGDVAFFDYPGGHVEIVVSGGKNPTFIYGDSATIDPATGNGQMEANTITSKANEGQVIYYLSPN